MAEIIGKRYLILKQLGKGGMADVYLASDLILKREVAIKILRGELSSDPIALERFNREAGAVTSLTHPNIVDIYDVGEDNNRHYIVMEYVEGYSLKQLIQKRGPLPVKEAIWLIKQLSSALNEAHRNGIVHRDVKSQNVLIKPDGTVKLSDFGIALANDAMQLTSKDAVLGSVHYLAPECAKGALATVQSDIYSLGVVLYEILSGDVPFKGDQPIKIAMQHIQKKIPLLNSINPKIPISVENIVTKATAKTLTDRYSNISLMLEDLNVCLSKEHQNDNRIVFTNKNNDKLFSLTKKTKSNKHKLLYRIFLGCISLATIVMILVVMIMGGVFKFNNKMVSVPELKGLSVIEADDLLDSYGLSIDYSNIERKMSDNIEAGLIIDFYPQKDTKIEKGGRIKVVVSEGIYAIAKNYVGRDIVSVRNELSKTFITIDEIPVDSEGKPGTIIAQEGLLAGSKYNPNLNTTIRLKYIKYPCMLIPFGYLGRNIIDVKNELENKGFKVKIEILKKDNCSDREQEYGTNNVVRINPSEGSSYCQEGNSLIYLYYFKEE